MRDFYTIGEVADLLGVRESNIYNYEKRGLIVRRSDPHRLYRSATYEKESVDQLAEEKRRFEATGPTMVELSKKLGMYDQQIKAAISALALEIPVVKSSFQRTGQRYAITPEQERQIVEYLRYEKPTRPKRNRLYIPLFDLARYQAFTMSGDQHVRLFELPDYSFGFRLPDEQVIPLAVAQQQYELQPKYTIHQPKQKGQNGFTDVVLPIGKPAFYRAVDALLSVCGVENFNAEQQGEELRLVVRNGLYAKNGFATDQALSDLQRHIQQGAVEDIGTHWRFLRNEKNVTIQLPETLHTQLMQQADREGVSVNRYIQQHVIEQVTNNSSKNEEE
ncbi:MerR family DNA-binding transcriptional regulator [Planococcus lenghuensis]|uniref:HTH merR-type domain-containing protein n=1 Tax=Planococcus lenghuensis TaxID=2213202 RepID=A0A1Q2L659_9BACL|nr:MerR family DNA-binding transcriptional regulator [Planococcus lenghuensis]AQQ55392.1 hypothetical protein B0X71_19680 [Planococcus lenghuensis]